MKGQFLSFGLVGVSVVLVGTIAVSNTPQNSSEQSSPTSSYSSTFPSETSGTAPSETSGTAPSETSGTAPSETSGTAPSATSGPTPVTGSSPGGPTPSASATQTPLPSATPPLASARSQGSTQIANPVYTAQFVNSPTNVLTTRGGTFSVLVIDQNSRPAVGVSISFKYRESSFTSQFSVMGTVNSDSSGYATLQYRFTSPGTPQVFAGSEATANYAKFWSTAHNITVAAPAFTASFANTPLKALTTQSTPLTVLVLDQNGNPAAGVPTTFRFRESSFTSQFSVMGTVNSDSSGYATLQYRFTSPGTPQVFAGSEATANYARFWSTAHNLTVAAPVFTASFVNPPANTSTSQETSFTVLVLDQNGNPAVGVPISLKFRTSSSTSFYTAMGTATSDNLGYATIQYRFTSSGTPQVFAGSEATANYARFWSRGITISVS